MSKHSHPVLDDLHVVAVSVISPTDCREWIESTQREITDDTVCAFPMGKSFCQTEVGGPLVVNGTLEGIVTTGDYYSESIFPDRFSRVTNVRDWIRRYSKV